MIAQDNMDETSTYLKIWNIHTFLYLSVLLTITNTSLCIIGVATYLKVGGQNQVEKQRLLWSIAIFFSYCMHNIKYCLYNFITKWGGLAPLSKEVGRLWPPGPTYCYAYVVYSWWSIKIMLLHTVYMQKCLKDATFWFVAISAGTNVKDLNIRSLVSFQQMFCLIKPS